MSWTIKKTADITGLPIDTLRYYDKEGLVSPKRSEGGYRQYDNDDIKILKNIVVMKYAHFSLGEIKNMEELFLQNPSADCNDISKHILSKKIAELRLAIYNYQRIVALMEKLLPMINSAESYQANVEQIDMFIEQIFQDIQHNRVSFNESIPPSDRNEVM